MRSNTSAVAPQRQRGATADAVDRVHPASAQKLLRWRQQPARVQCDPFDALIGLAFDICNDGRSRSRLSVRSELLNPHGVLHVGILYSMADTVMGAALYSQLETETLCTTI